MRIKNWIFNDFWFGLIVGALIGSQALWGIFTDCSDMIGFKRFVRMPKGAYAMAVFRPKIGSWLNVTWYDWYVPVELEEI